MTAVDSTPEHEAPTGSHGDQEPSVVLAGYATVGGLVAWALHLWASTSLVSTACQEGVTWVMNLVTLGLALVAAGALLASVRLDRVVSRTAARNGRTRMLAVVTGIMNLASLALIILEGIPILVIEPCKLS